MVNEIGARNGNGGALSDEMNSKALYTVSDKRTDFWGKPIPDSNGGKLGQEVYEFDGQGFSSPHAD